ncbi:hypothetical protein B0H34DRAFT_794277 [Crassisporium funariophilum]|nr:hypothetical protein B0H34DRAFT_794277 [Crassisporium funariophilum]
MQTKINLLCVCTRWRSLALAFAYETVLVKRQPTQLLNFLENSEKAAPGEGYGRLIRTLILSAWDQQFNIRIAYVNAFSTIISFCPNITALIKLNDKIVIDPALNLNFSSLQRFDWWAASIFKVSYPPRDNFASNVRALRAIVSQAPNLQYLSIGHAGNWQPSAPSGSFIAPNIRTLRLRWLSASLAQELDHWSFPKLTHIITDSSAVSLQTGIPRFFGPGIQTLEFTRDRDIHHPPLLSLAVISCCPSLRQLNYCIEFASFPPNLPAHKSLRSVGIHVSTNLALDCGDGDGSQLKSHYEAHFAVFSGFVFPALDEVVIYWPSIQPTPSFYPSLIHMLDREGNLRYSEVPCPLEYSYKAQGIVELSNYLFSGSMQDVTQ